MAEPITLRVDGQIYEGWQKVRITRSLRDIAGDFELSLTRKWTNASEMVIKPLGPLMRDIPCVSGGAVLGQGEVVLVLDVPEIEAVGRGRGRFQAA